MGIVIILIKDTAGKNLYIKGVADLKRLGTLKYSIKIVSLMLTKILITKNNASHIVFHNTT